MTKFLGHVSLRIGEICESI